MLELIIWGFILFIGGVGATIAYDRHKAKQAANVPQPRGSLRSNPPQASAQAPSQNRFTKPATKEELLKRFLQDGNLTAEEFQKIFSGDN